MIINKSISILLTRNITNILKLKHFYRVDDILRKKSFQFVPFYYIPAYHLYLNKLQNSKFNQKYFLALLTQHGKQNRSLEQFNSITQIGYKSIDKFSSYKVISLYFSYAYDVKYQDKKILEAFGHRAFQLISQMEATGNNRIQGYSLVRLLIYISRLIGLDKFKDQEFQGIQLQRIKPLFIVYMLQLFWQQNLQYRSKFPRKLLEYLKQNQKFISFSDAYHMVLTKRIVKDPDFIQISDRLQKRMKSNVGASQEGNLNANVDSQSGLQNKNKVDQQVAMLLYRDYVRDLQKKYL